MAITLTAGTDFFYFDVGYGRAGTAATGQMGSISAQPVSGKTLDSMFKAASGGAHWLYFVGDQTGDGTPSVTIDGNTIGVGTPTYYSGPGITEYHLNDLGGFGGFVSGNSYSVDISFGGGSGTDDLTANDVESDSEVSSPSIGQEHGLTASDVESASEVSAPAVGQVHALLASDTESASEVSAPALAEVHVLTADDVEAASEVTSPAFGQIHALLADDAESTSETTSPAIGQIHALAASSVESGSEVSAPTLQEGSHALSGDDVESASEVSVPAIGQIHALLADDAEATSETTAPNIGQVHVLLADDVESASEVTAPTAAEISGEVLSAESVEAASEVSAPTLAQVHVLYADAVEAASEVSAPVLNRETKQRGGGWLETVYLDEKGRPVDPWARKDEVAKAVEQAAQQAPRKRKPEVKKAAARVIPALRAEDFAAVTAADLAVIASELGRINVEAARALEWLAQEEDREIERQRVARKRKQNEDAIALLMVA